MDIKHLKTWAGRSEASHDVITLAPMRALADTLDRTAAPELVLPPLWHWLYFLPRYRQSEAGPDGHVARGGFLPPVPLPRRMWAGSRVQWHDELREGDAVKRVSTIKSVEHKTGKTGELVFVEVHHDISSPRGLAVHEEHDIVYRGMSGYVAPQAVPEAAWRTSDWAREVNGDALMLFRYSALTFNGHRIHYDRAYVTQEEGYPGLIVHGPLMATWLMELAVANNPARRVAAYEFRALSPVFDLNPFVVCGTRQSAPGGDGCDVWIRRHDGVVAMQGHVGFA